MNFDVISGLMNFGVDVEYASENGKEQIKIDGKTVSLKAAKDRLAELKGDISYLRADAKAAIATSASQAVLAIAGNPSSDEIASWPEKIAAAKAVLAGQDFDVVILASTMQDHGVDAPAAAQIILLRARLYRLAKAAAEIIANGAKQAIEVAKDEATINAALEGFRVALDGRQAQFMTLALAAKGGNIKPLEMAEAEIIGA